MREHQAYPLFVALTRPPMVMGVTQTFFILNLMLSLILFLGGLKMVPFAVLPIFALSLLLLFFGLHLTGAMCCKKEPYFFELWSGKLELICPNRLLWKCNSYDPS
jgi:type IV secretion system protein VirB3